MALRVGAAVTGIPGCMELSVGDFVVTLDFPELGVGTVTHIPRPSVVRVEWSLARSANNGNWFMWELVRCCRNCHKPPSAHLSDYCCLFGPSKWA